MGQIPANLCKVACAKPLQQKDGTPKPNPNETPTEPHGPVPQYRHLGLPPALQPCLGRMNLLAHNIFTNMASQESLACFSGPWLGNLYSWRMFLKIFQVVVRCLGQFPFFRAQFWDPWKKTRCQQPPKVASKISYLTSAYSAGCFKVERLAAVERPFPCVVRLLRFPGGSISSIVNLNESQQ